MELNFIKLGFGQPLIILHGLFGMLDNWITLGRKFSEDFEVYLVDIRNHGKSPHNSEHNYTALCEDLDDFIKSNKIINPWIIGHSMGGKIAMNYGLNFNSDIAGLVIVDISPRQYNIHHLDIFEALLKIDIATIKSRNEASNILENEGISMPITQFLLKNLERVDSNSFKWKFNLDVLKNNLENIGSIITSHKPFNKPCLFLKGELSNYISDKDSAIIEDLFLNSEIICIKNAGHWIHAEKSEEFYDLVWNFLKKNRG